MERWLQRGCSEPFDLIYADPPYAAGLYAPIIELITAGGWLKSDGQLLLECSTNDRPLPPKGWQQKRERRYGRSQVLQWGLDAG